MACAATAFASAGDAHAVDWTAVGRWTVLVFCAIVLARPLCAGLRALKRVHVTMRRKGGALMVKNVTKPVMEVFEITGFAGMLKFI